MVDLTDSAFHFAGRYQPVECSSHVDVRVAHEFAGGLQGHPVLTQYGAVCRPARMEFTVRHTGLLQVSAPRPSEVLFVQ